MKKWYESKTLWLNVILFVLAALAMPEIIAVLPASWLPYIAAVAAIGNGVLRVWFTDRPVQK